MAVTGHFEFRKTFWGKLVLRVEEEVKPFWQSKPKRRWRDAALMDLAVTRGMPIANGILTVDTQSQAQARASLDEADKGGEAVRTVLAMIRLKRRLAAG